MATNSPSSECPSDTLTILRVCACVLKKYKCAFIELISGYATGLLVARRVLKKLKLDTKYKGNSNVNGEDFMVTPIDGDVRPFKCFLDVGLRRTSTGSKVFAAMKV
jgi:large subunit ribosomal protein L5e